MPIALPGKKAGPCEKACGHLFCQRLREIAESECPICLQPIGYEVTYVSYEERYFHKSCLCQTAYSKQTVGVKS